MANLIRTTAYSHKEFCLFQKSLWEGYQLVARLDEKKNGEILVRLKSVRLSNGEEREKQHIFYNIGDAKRWIRAAFEMFEPVEGIEILHLPEWVQVERNDRLFNEWVDSVFWEKKETC